MTISGIFSRGIVRQLRVRVRHRLAFWRAFGVRHRFYTTKRNSSRRKTARARAVYRCPWRLRTLATPNRPVLPHAVASIVTSTLTPFSTGTGAHFITTRSHPP